MRVTITEPAKLRLKDIFLYYKELGQPKKGRRIRVAILKKALQLKQHPQLGQIEEHLLPLNEGHRYLLEKPYKIIYKKIDNYTIAITDIFDTRQDPSKMIS